MLNPDQFWLPYPVPALAKDQRDFNPTGFWQGPSWPAATTHVVEAFAAAAKSLDRSLLSQAGELLLRAARVHLRPRPDFYERYHPIDGRPLNKFRDYMHSWWIDLIIQHAAGLMVRDDGSVVIDPLPMGLEYFELRGAPVRGKRIDVLWHKPREAGLSFKNPPNVRSGLVVRLDGKTVFYRAAFKPGDDPVRLDLR
ncbi:MAG: hypothetical protein HY735_01135 [Verrucomicrobia bacterium]|nr:hypothetical protein [Verrucomicrobiota bacterium]